MNYVPGEGPTDARIVIVGEAPGAAEDMQKRPFVGPSGNLLNQSLANVGIFRNQCYVTNIIKRRPPDNDFGVFYRDSSRNQPSDNLTKAIDELHEEISRISPNVVIALGNEPLRALTGKRSVEKWRGSILWSEKLRCKIVSTYHPAFIMRMYHLRAIMELDLRKALKESLSAELNLPQHRFILDPSCDQIFEVLSRPFRRLAVDIETVGRHTRCIGLAWSKTEAICIPLMVNQYSPHIGSKTLFITPQEKSSKMNSRWSPEIEFQILQKLKLVLEDPSIEKILQNFPFDSQILAQELGIVIKGLHMDTLVAQHCCYAEFPKALDFLCSVYTRVPYYSDYSPSVDLEVWRYNCYDCCVDFEVAEALTHELEEFNLWEFYKYHAEPLMLALARIGSRGVLVDVDERKRQLKIAKETLEKSSKRLNELIGHEFNYNSHPQCKKLMYDTLRVPKQFHPKKGTVTADEEALLNVREAYPQHSELIDLILNCRAQKKLIGTFLETKLDENNRLVTSYNSNGTVTGRISSSTTVWGDGANIQQTPRGELRRMFISPQGSSIIKSDLKQAEARATVWFAGVKKLIDRFLNDPTFDIHRWNAANIHDISERDVSKSQRQSAKGLTHGADYRLGPRTTARIQRVSYAQAKRALEKYLSALPELALWWSELEQCMHESRTITTPLGRRRIFFGRLDHALYREATAFLPQSTVGDVINRAIILAEFVVRDIKPIIQMHDEIDFEVKDNDIPQAKTSIRNILEYPLQIEGVPEPLVIPAEIAIGKNWYDVKEEASG